MNKLYPSAAAALEGLVRDGQLFAVGGFGLCGIPGVRQPALLEARTREVQAHLPASNRRAMGELNRLVRALEAECREGHAEYTQHRDGLSHLCDAIVAESHPAA